MTTLHIIILAIVQGLAELLPVSSSAHVIVAEKLMGLDPSKPEMTLLLVMLHTGTMFAVILYFWRAWKDSIFASPEVFRQQALRLVDGDDADRRRRRAAHSGHRKGRLEKLGYRGQRCQRPRAKGRGRTIVRQPWPRRRRTRGGGRFDPHRRTGRTQNGRKAGDWDPRRRMDRRRARLVPAVSRVFAVRGNDFNRPAAGQSQSKGGGIQFRPGGDHYPGRHRTRSVAIGSKPITKPAARRNVELVRPQPLGHGLCLPGRFAGPQVAFPLAGGGAWYLFGIYCLWRRPHLCSPRGRLLSPLSVAISGRRDLHFPSTSGEFSRGSKRRHWDLRRLPCDTAVPLPLLRAICNNQGFPAGAERPDGGGFAYP